MGIKYKGSERRKFNRVEVNFIALCRLRRSINVLMSAKSKEVDALMLDLSEAGLALSVNKNVPVSTKFLIKFVLVNTIGYLGQSSRPVKLVGEVRSSTLLEKDRYRLGVTFKKISSKDRLAIANFVQSTSGS